MRMLSLRQKARLWNEFKSLRLFILDAVSVYITVNNYDLIISNRVVISRNTGLFGKKYVAYAVGHDDHCLRGLLHLSAFSEFSANRANVRLARPNRCEAIVRKTVKNL